MRHAPDVEAAVAAVLGPIRPNDWHEWVAMRLARSRGATLTQDAMGAFSAADAASLETLTQALKDVAVYYRVGYEAFAAMAPEERLAYIRAARERGGWGPRA